MNVNVTPEIEKLAALLAKTDGKSTNLPTLNRTDYDYDNDSYGVLSGEKTIAAAQLASKTSKLTLLQVVVTESLEDEEIAKAMLEIESEAQPAPAPAPAKLSKEEKALLISKLAAELAAECSVL